MRLSSVFRVLAFFCVVASAAPHLQAQSPAAGAPDPAIRALEMEDAAAARRARLWSLGATVLPMVIMPLTADKDGYPNVGAAMLAGLGIYAGPAVGYWMEGDASRGWAGVGIRFGAAMAGGIIAAAVMGDGRKEPGSSETSVAVAAMYGAFGGIVWSAVHDIRDVDDHVRRVRARTRHRTASLTFAPVLNPASSTAGFRAAIAF